MCRGMDVSQCMDGSVHRLHGLVFLEGLWTVNPAWHSCGSTMGTLMGLTAAPQDGLEGGHAHTMCRADLPQDRCLLEFLEVSRAKDDPPLLFFSSQ